MVGLGASGSDGIGSRSALDNASIGNRLPKMMSTGQGTDAPSQIELGRTGTFRGPAQRPADPYREDWVAARWAQVDWPSHAKHDTAWVLGQC